jgi:uncharacterized protein (TIGR03437 family)
MSAVSLWAQSDDPTARTIASLNAQILRAAQGSDTELSLRQRFPLLRELIGSNPDRALPLAFPDETIARLSSAYSSAGALLETRGQWEGTGIAMVEDSKDPRHSRTYLRLHSPDGDLNIYPAHHAAAIQPDAHRFRVEGVRAGDSVAAVHILALEPAAATGTCSTTGNQKTIGLLVKIPDSPDPTFTAAQVQDWLFGSFLSLNGYWQEASYGQTSASGTVAGWFTMTQPYTVNQLDNIRADTFQQAAAQGIDLTQYSRIMLFLPSLQGNLFEAGSSTIGCTNWTQGNSTVYASVSWVFDSASATTDEWLADVIHEAGHGLGLDHSTSLLCGVVSLGPAGDACPTSEYGDPYSDMGQGLLGHYAAPQKYALGWLHDADVATVTASGAVLLQPLSAQGSGTKALRIPRTTGGTDWLWMEAREAVGLYDTTNFSLRALTGGAIIHFQPQDPAGPDPVSNLTRTQLLDIPPGSLANNFGAAIAPGGSWTDVFSGLTVSVAQAANSAVNVSLSRDNACVTLSSAATTVSGNGGTGSLQVIAGPGCAWTASSGYSWLTIQGSASGVGNGTVTFQAAPNNGAAREGLLLIGARGVTVTQPPLNAPPAIIGATPANVAGPAASLTLSISDNTPNNYATVWFNITAGAAAQGACMVSWNGTDGTFRLMNDDGATWSNPAASNYSIDLENSHCAILSAFSEYTGQNDSVFSLVVQVVLKNPAAGIQVIYLRALDRAGNDTGWQSVGSWAPAADRAPAQPVLPDLPGTGLQHAFVIPAADPDGASDLKSVEVDIGTGSHVCSATYFFNGNGVEFRNDDGTLSGWVAGNPNSVSNSDCSLDLLRTSATTTGNTRMVILPVTFKSGLTGQQPVRVTVTDWSGLTGQVTSSWNVAASSAAPVISAAGVVNAASYAGGGVAPGEIVTIFGSGLGPSPLQSAAYTGSELQQTVGGTTVFFNGVAAPLVYASGSAVSAIVPLVFGQNVSVEVASNGGISNVVTVPAVNEAPGVFAYPSSQQAVVVNQDGSYNLNTPAARGTYITFFITGAGLCVYNNAEFMDIGGIPPASPWAAPAFPVYVKFGADPAYQAAFAGLVFPGVVQVNAYVYSSAPTGDAVPLQVVFTDPTFVTPTGPVAQMRIR